MAEKPTPLEVAQSRLNRARELKAAKIRNSDKLTHELGMLADHISDLKDIVDSFEKENPNAGK